VNSPAVQTILASFYTHQAYRTTVSNDHNSQQLKLVSKPPHRTDKSSQSYAKIALHCKTCTIATKRQNCTKIVLYQIAVFCWVYSNTSGIHCKHMASHFHVEVRTWLTIIDIITISFRLHFEQTDCTINPQRACQAHCGRLVVII